MVKKYKCEKCEKTVERKEGSIPECCGKPMKQLPLDFCMQPAHPEHARPMDNEEPCDEGRAG
jgi:hypothetical protein